jgi:hypothetical protein
MVHFGLRSCNIKHPGFPENHHTPENFIFGFGVYFEYIRTLLAYLNHAPVTQKMDVVGGCGTVFAAPPLGGCGTVFAVPPLGGCGTVMCGTVIDA